MFELLSASVDVVHALAMLVWGIGLPLLFWQRWPALSRGYMVYALAFIATSVASQLLLDECFLTSLARHLAERGTNEILRQKTSFTVRFVESVAAVRPTERLAVRLWELAIFATCMAMLVRLWRHAGHGTRIMGDER
jgi:hypothetical protein